MTIEKIIGGLENLVLHEPASIDTISQLEVNVGKELPKTYLQLLGRSNGLEGFVSETAYLIIWPAEELTELNEGYRTLGLPSTLWLFGSNGGDAGYAFDTLCDPMPVKEVVYLDILTREPTIISSDFETFFEKLRR